jgi:Flp pilus assembly protein TadG
MTGVRSLLTRPEQGSGPAVSAAILMPVFALVLLAVAAGGRVSNASDATDQAARAAARIASIQRDPNAAESLGQPSTVTATVSCQVMLAELAFPGIPGDRTVTATFTSPVDQNRERP